MKSKHILYWLIYMGWILMIFIFSSQNGDTSSHTSRPIIDFIIQICANFDLSPTVIQVTTIVRKSAHFMEYAVLGYITRRNVGLNAQPLFYLSGFVPFLDEALQSQIAGRIGSLNDILIDLAGYSMGILIARMTEKRSVS